MHLRKYRLLANYGQVDIIITRQAHIALDFQTRFQCSLNVCIGIASVY